MKERKIKQKKTTQYTKNFGEGTGRNQGSSLESQMEISKLSKEVHIHWLPNSHFFVYNKVIYSMAAMV